jgi:hypothetical protein
VSAGVAFSGEATLFDLLFTSFIPTFISSCDPWTDPGASCQLPIDPCLGSASGAFVGSG